MTITPVQIKMAKAALGWSNPKLSEMMVLHPNSLSRIESGISKKPSTLKLLRLIFEQGSDTHYIEFLDDNGARLLEKEPAIPESNE